MYDDLSLSAEFNAPFDTVISPSAQCLGANSKGNDPVSNQESLFTQVLRSQLAEKEAESVKQKSSTIWLLFLVKPRGTLIFLMRV